MSEGVRVVLKPGERVYSRDAFKPCDKDCSHTRAVHRDGKCLMYGCGCGKRAT